MIYAERDNPLFLAIRSPLRFTFGSIVRLVLTFFIGVIVCAINTHSSLKKKLMPKRKVLLMRRVCVAKAYASPTTQRFKV